MVLALCGAGAQAHSSTNGSARVYVDVPSTPADSSNVTFHVWLEVDNEIQKSPSECRLEVFDADGASIFTKTQPDHAGRGVFSLQWYYPETEKKLNAVLDRDASTFFARIAITADGRTTTTGTAFKIWWMGCGGTAPGSCHGPALQAMQRQPTDRLQQ